MQRIVKKKFGGRRSGTALRPQCIVPHLSSAAVVRFPSWLLIHFRRLKLQFSLFLYGRLRTGACFGILFTCCHSAVTDSFTVFILFYFTVFTFFQRFHAGFCFYPTQKSQNSTITQCKQTKRFRPAEASDLIMLTRFTGRPTILKLLNFRIGPIQSPAL